MEAKIFKIQVDMTGRFILVYNEDRSIFGQIPATEELLNELHLEAGGKGYYECLAEDNLLEVLAEVNEQYW